MLSLLPWLVSPLMFMNSVTKLQRTISLMQTCYFHYLVRKKCLCWFNEPKLNHKNEVIFLPGQGKGMELTEVCEVAPHMRTR